MVRKVLFNFLFNVGLGKILYEYNSIRTRVPILVFHRISPNYDAYTEPISPEQFEKILLFLNKFYKIIPLKELFKKNKLNGNTCVITFDDALKDFIDYAYPIIRKHNIPVTIFIPTESIEIQRSLWNYQFFGMFLKTMVKQIDIKINQKLYIININKDYDIIRLLHNTLLSLTKKQREIKLNEISNKLNLQGNNSHFAPPMSREDLRKLSMNELIDFGSHSHSHLFLPVEERETIETDLQKSINLIQKITGSPPDYLAYPYGGYPDKFTTVIKKYFEAGLTTENKPVKEKTLKNRYAIPRYLIHYIEPKEIFLRINGLDSLIQSVKKFKNIFKRL